MATVFRAEDVPTAERTDYWLDVVSTNVHPIHVRREVSGDFTARIMTGQLGAIRVTEADCPPTEAYNTPKLVRDIDHEKCTIMFLTRGRNLFEQNGRQCELGPGDFVVIDSTMPFRTVHTDLSHVSLVFPRSMLPIGRDALARLAGEGFSGEEGIGSLVSAFARRLPRHLDDPGAADATRLGSTVLDLVSVALRERLGHGKAPEGSGRGLLACIHAFIEEHLSDPDLSPGDIAAAHHISVRYVHKLFQREGMTAAGWIRGRRLERCRGDLLDPALADRSIGATAVRWGFRGGAHFNRTFRAVYGVPPGEYRMMHAASDPVRSAGNRVAS